MNSPDWPPPRPMPGPVGEPFINRHWKWLVPVGCLGLLVMLGAFALGTLVVVFTAIKSSDVYREAIQIARAHPGVRSELGDPIETGWFVSGSVQVTGPSGHADISVPLSGSRRSGTLYGVADKSAGRWAFSLLEVEVEGRAGRLELRGKAP